MGTPAGMPAISAHTRLLVVAPHPDDETIATGLLIQQVRAAGGEVRILLLTAGDNNPWPQRWLEHRWRIRSGDRQRWARRRHGELQEALATLGIAPSGLQALGWSDLGVTEMLLQATDEAVAVIGETMAQFGPDLIALPSLSDRHPDHSAAHVLVRLALTRHPTVPTLLAYLVHGSPGEGDFVEISPVPAQQATKIEALGAHSSQTALSCKRLHRLAARPERYTDPGDGSLALASLPWRPPRWLRRCLRLSVVDASGARDWSWPEAPLQEAADGRFQLLLPGPGPAAPRFVRLSFKLPSPWIFDHWGWCELRTQTSPPSNPVA